MRWLEPSGLLCTQHVLTGLCACARRNVAHGPAYEWERLPFPLARVRDCPLYSSSRGFGSALQLLRAARLLVGLRLHRTAFSCMCRRASRTAVRTAVRTAATPPLVPDEQHLSRRREQRSRVALSASRAELMRLHVSTGLSPSVWL